MQIKAIKRIRTLFLIRHAKSCWKNDLIDFERSLKKRGIKDSNLVSSYLTSYSITPDIILCSSAKRTRETSAIFIKNLALYNVNIRYLKQLYDFSGESLTQVIESCDDSFDTVMIFGHNYALTNFVNKYGDIYVENVTTSGFVKIIFEIESWKKLKKGHTEKIVFPKLLK